MSKKAMIAGIAGILVCILAGLACILWIQNDFIQLPVLGLITGIGAYLIVSMGKAVAGPVAQPVQDAQVLTEISPVQDTSHQSTLTDMEL